MSKKSKLKNQIKELEANLEYSQKEFEELLAEKDIMQQRIDSQVQWLADKDSGYKELKETKDQLIEALQAKLDIVSNVN